MKILIIEDEARAASHLERLLHQIDPSVVVLAKLESIRDSVNYLQRNSEPDLIFSDIQLADGLSFAIFSQVKLQCPIIFTTAYDHYAIEAFTTNGIDYLLKPIEPQRLQQAMDKAGRFSASLLMSKLMQLTMPAPAEPYKTRFMVKVGDKIRPVDVGEVRLFFSQERSTFLLSAQMRTFAIDFTLDQLEPLLDPARFFRINRKYLVSITACNHIVAWSNSRLLIRLEGFDAADLIVARERVQEFKNWLDR